ncbi:MAG: hypothetical protein OEY14_18950, partial [Myxococcales bacterium]|nr:hypothetical protein [Myxococcales bacterium]
VEDVHPATLERTASEVFYADGFEKQAQEVAKAIPGGAAAKPMTWETAADLVIAVGSSALGL